MLNDAQGYDLEEIVVYGSGEARETFFQPWDLLGLLGAPLLMRSAGRVLTGQAGSIGSRTGTGALDDALRVLRPGRSSNTRLVESADELESLFGRITAGGRPIQGTKYPGRMMEMPDGAKIGIRPTSRSGGPTIDIHRATGTSIKVHVGR